MSIMDFLVNNQWDAPFFKILARNDTAQATGHQAGMVIPKDLRHYFPTLDEKATSQLAPTVDRHLRAELYYASIYKSDQIIRYQFQTWGGTRSAESRLTDGLRPIREYAEEGDIMLFQRDAEILDHFRIVLVKKGTPEFAEISDKVIGRRWGPLDEANPPIDQSRLEKAHAEIVEITQHPFEISKSEIKRFGSEVNLIARSSVFRELVQAEYSRKCAVSNIGILSPDFQYEVESAHIIPLSEGGTDDIRNGFALTRTLHWAFDRGLFGVLPNRTIYIPRQVKKIQENNYLKQFEKKLINEAKNKNLRVHPDAFYWHFNNRVRQWN